MTRTSEAAVRVLGELGIHLVSTELVIALELAGSEGSMRSSHSWPEFPHRANGNGTTSSICPCCYVTVATSTFEADLERAEIAHVCDPKQLRTFESTHKPPFRVTWHPQTKLDKLA